MEAWSGLPAKLRNVHQNDVVFDSLLEELYMFTFILYNDYDTPGKHYNSLLIPLGALWTIQHLTVTVTFKDLWQHDLHDLTEKRSQIPRTIDNIIYMT